MKDKKRKFGLRRPCKRCEKLFYKTGSFQRLCHPCIEKANGRIPKHKKI